MKYDTGHRMVHGYSTVLEVNTTIPKTLAARLFEAFMTQTSYSTKDENSFVVYRCASKTDSVLKMFLTWVILVIKYFVASSRWGGMTSLAVLRLEIECCLAA